MISVSELTGRTYVDEECVYFRNLYQCAFYIAHHVMPIEMFTDGNGKLVMVFDRNQHNEMIKLWMANKEQEQDQDRANNDG